VQHSYVVRCGEPRAELPRNLNSFIRRQAAYAPKQRCQIFAAHELHGKKVLAVNFANVVDAADVAVRNLPRGSHLSVKAGERRSIV
jgi:hypothetical protein